MIVKTYEWLTKQYKNKIARKPTRLKHEVKVKIPEREIQREDTIFSFKIDDKPFGVLKVSEGSLVWFPKGKQLGSKISWTQLAQLMQDNAISHERR